MDRFSWILEIENYEKYLKAVLKDYSDLSLLNEILSSKNGAAATIKIYENFEKTDLRFPQRPITELKKVYVFQNRRLPAKTLARKLNVDVVTIYNWLREYGLDCSAKSGNLDLFEG